MEGRLYIPRLHVRSNISFCVDTGADKTTLLPTDGIRMNLNYSALEQLSQARGLGGVANVNLEQAVVVFSEGKKRLYGYEIELAIIAPDDALMDMPSLLGRDILDRWRMNYSPSTGDLLFHVVSYDYMTPSD